MILKHHDKGFIYTVRTICGRPAEVTKRYGDNGRDTPIEWSDVPFLVQTSIEVRIQEQLDNIPKGFYGN